MPQAPCPICNRQAEVSEDRDLALLNVACPVCGQFSISRRATAALTRGDDRALVSSSIRLGRVTAPLTEDNLPKLLEQGPPEFGPAEKADLLLLAENRILAVEGEGPLKAMLQSADYEP